MIINGKIIIKKPKRIGKKDAVKNDAIPIPNPPNIKSAAASSYPNILEGSLDEPKNSWII